nr:hypothetical protein [Tanacetum cinerariifolium]
ISICNGSWKNCDDHFFDPLVGAYVTG